MRLLSIPLPPSMLAPALVLLASAPLAVFAGDVLKTNGFSICKDNADIQVQRLNIQFDRATKQIDFDIAGTSAKEQNVSASMIVSAYGRQVYQKDFKPCDPDNFVAQLCPVPVGTFSAQGSQQIPSSFSSQVPDIAFSVPDLDGNATLQLHSLDDNKELACITSTVNNGKSFNVPGASYVIVGIAGAALALSAMASALAAGHGGASHSPTFCEIMLFFHGNAMNGMSSVNMPSLVRSWTNNFAAPSFLISWGSMQASIDSFRQNTGGNLTDDSYAFLKDNATVIQSGTKVKRGLDALFLMARDAVHTSVNGTAQNSTADNKVMHTVHGIQGYVEALTIPQANTFMTVMLVFAIVIAAITVGILLFKVILETWAMFGSFPKSLTNFRKRYWWLLAQTITTLILVLYSVWVMYCVYQFRNGDSWAAKLLAGITLTVFTAVLAFFTWKIWSIARKVETAGGDHSALHDDPEVWRKYSFFYDNYKKSYWWLFVPAIVYMFAKGCVIAGADGHGLAQSAGQLIIEALLLGLLLWYRPFTLKSSNWINISIQVVRVLSIICILVFVEELGIAQTTKTITGLVLVVSQAVLTGLLAILIAVNAIVILCKQNPHRKKQEEAEKMRNLDNLTPLDARNSLLMDPTEYKGAQAHHAQHSRSFGSKGGYESVPLSEQHPHLADRNGSGTDPLLHHAASFGNGGHDHARAPRLPDVGRVGNFGNGRGY